MSWRKVLGASLRCGLMVATQVLSLGVALGLSPRAEAQASSTDPLDAELAGLPPAARLDKVSWSASAGVTRIRFRVGRPASPTLARPQPNLVRLDVSAISAEGTPAQLAVGTPEVLKVTRVPAALDYLLPEGISARFLVRLADPGAATSVVEAEDGFTLLVGDAGKIGAGATWQGDPPSNWIVQALEQGTTVAEREIAPNGADFTPTPFAVVLTGPQAVRRGPSSLHPPTGATVREDRALAADALRGDWAHLVAGGWIVAPPPARVGIAGAASSARRTPYAWTLLTLGTGIAVDIMEMVRGIDPLADAAVALFAEPVPFVRMNVQMTGPPSVIAALPPKAGRLMFTLVDGREVASVDPRSLRLREGASESQRERAFQTPRLHSGEEWAGWVPIPPDLDLAAVSEVRVDLDGRLHLAFQVPGSGERVDDTAPAR